MAAPARSGRAPRTKEVFRGPRLGVAVRAALRARSLVLVLLVSVVVGVLIAGGVATAIWYLVQAVVHAGNST